MTVYKDTLYFIQQENRILSHLSPRNNMCSQVHLEGKPTVIYGMKCF